MPRAKLKYGVEFTRNLGNFQNVKPNFELTVDAEFDSLEDLDVIKEEIAKKVDQWLVDKVNELDEELAGK